MKRARDQLAGRNTQEPAVLLVPPSPVAEQPPAPALVPAYFHKSPIQLYDVTAPIPTHALKADAAWTPFSQADSEALEGLYQNTLLQGQSTESEADGEEVQADRPHEAELVGFERLHQVCLHTWQMTPVYWHAKHAHTSKASVTRGTWFYAATWQPLPHALADLVEAGFQDVKPWTETYSAELEAATSLGEEATAKLKHPVDSIRYIIYRDGQRAWVGSNTLTARLTGRVMASLGRHSKNALVEVCRGYDFDASQNKVFLSIAQKDETVSRSPPAVTDLILVVHGIGQKLAETSEGWTFTHAVNRLRVNLHTQLAMPSAEQNVRPGFKFQVLPVNWRINLDLDAPPAADSDPKSFFTLDDITIDGIPAVRSLIGQVVLDIPYYMSHHKASMVDATVREANRIYALWIKHNRDFARSGRVHLVAHSLGSAITFDILSQQPTDINTSASLSTRLGRALSIRPPEDQERAGQFAFNTTNLFCAGSPAAFFLLLHRRHLVPRRRQTADHDNPDATDGKVTGQQGTYGSLACKNIYNLFYNTDPISYRMMATVDAALAQSLPPTHIPSTAAPYFSSFFSAAEKGEAPSNVSRPDLNRLPSTVELPQHDFSRERIADARLAMLNENRQIDYQLPAPGGLLEGSSQYLSMMTAHQAYWDSSEFARLLVLECGRRPGREHTLAMMRGVKRPEVPEGSKYAREYMSDAKKHSR